MAQDHNDIYSIVERLAILEGRITPATVKHGLNNQQKSVPQMPALFKPKTQKILGGDADDKNPMSGYAVGGCEERLLLEEHLLPLMKSGIEKVIPVEVVIQAVDVLKTAILDRLGRFFFDERIALHQKFAFEPGGVIQERFEKEAELTKINSEFQKKLEDLVFNVDASEGRLFLVRWAKDWYDSLIGDMLAFIEKDTLQEQIARDTLDEFRAMKRRNLEAFLMDTRSYAAARELIDKQWNSLVFRMRSDLVKKNGKASS